MAPEISSLAGRRPGGAYGKEVDYFSLGICLFVMLTGSFPKRAQSELTKRGYHGIVEFFDADELEQLPVSTRDLVRGLTRKEPRERYGFEQCHRWVSEQPTLQ